MPSASKSALLLSPCLRWAWSGAKEYESEFADTTKRDKGTLFHSAMDAYYREGEKWLKVCVHSPEVTGWVRLAIAWSKEHLEPRCQSVYSEVYVGTNFSTGKSVCDPNVKNRKYPDMPGYLPGTTDLVCILKTTELLIADWKTGRGVGADKQLLTLAVGLREQFPLPDGTLRAVRVAVLYATPDGVHPHEWEVTSDELEAHRLAMHFQLVDVGTRTEPVPGIYCTQLYCPHLAYCPGITATVDCAAESPEGLLPAKSLVRKYDISAAPTGHKHAGSIMERVTAAKRQLEFYQERVRKYCESGGKCIAGEFEYSKQKDGYRWRPKK